MFGQVPFNSRVDKRVEHLPVAISLVGTSDINAQVIDMAEQCPLNFGRPTRVKTGRYMFGENC